MPNSDHFLEAYFSDCMNEMRWRRDVEYKLISLLVPLFPALVGGFFALSLLLPPTTVIVSSLALITFVWFLFWYVRRKVKAENVIYKILGSIVATLWEHFNLFKEDAYLPNKPILPGASKNFGRGEGYKLTLDLLFGISLVTTLMLLGICIFADRGLMRSSATIHSEDSIRQVIGAARDANPDGRDWSVRSLEWQPGTKDYHVVLRKDGVEQGYIISLDPTGDLITKIQRIDILAPLGKP